MVVVAVAGGSGDLGKTIVEELQNNSKYSVKILSRKPTQDNQDQSDAVIYVDYNDTESITKALEEHNVHTVICTISIRDDTQSKAQLNLIKAADKSSVTKRFAPSEWSFVYTKEQIAALPVVAEKLKAHEELKKSSLEYTLFSPGWFSDYYGIPHVKSHLRPFTFVVDIPNNTAAIPGTGDTPITFTHTTDVAKFVAASLDLDQWPERSFIVGEKATWRELVELAEAARGQKFVVKYDDLEKLKSSQITELPSHQDVYQFIPKEALQSALAAFGLWSATGGFDIPTDGSLNMKFPHIKPMSLKVLLDQAWKGK